MNIQIKSRQDIELFTYDAPYIVISITDPKDNFPSLLEDANRLAVLQLRFCDVDDGEVKYLDVIKDSQAKQIVDFVDNYKEDIDCIVCQCAAGISRSAGVAAALLKIFNGNDSLVFRMCVPNRTVYRKVLKEWECGPGGLI